MDERFFRINRLLSDYSLGNFDKKLKVSSRMDEIDAFISGVNMLGEELKEKTISRDYFNNIFNSVSDMVLVLDRQGKISNVNEQVTRYLQYDRSFLLGKPVGFLVGKADPGWFTAMVKQIRSSGAASYEMECQAKDNIRIPVLVSASFLAGADRQKGNVLLTAKDISVQKEAQNRVLQAIIETEENERTRLSKDIHDSIGQQLSAVKFYIGTSVMSVQDPKQKEILLKANAALLDVQAEMRNVCFNLMPSSLEMFGLIKAVKELCSKNELLEDMRIVIKEPARFPALPVQQAFALFRIIQEFINNTLKHSGGDKIRITFAAKNKIVLITLADNGKGFDMAKLPGEGMGLNNVRSRIKPYKGEVHITSKPGKGTTYKIVLPVTH